MKKEIKVKFRAWEEEKKRWITSFEECYLCDDGTIVVMELATGWDQCNYLKNTKAIPSFNTGLKDKNGKDIFEGDVITGNTSYERSSDEAEWTKEKPCVVLWSERCAGFYPFIMNNRWRCDVENIEVIGNIYENPELNKDKL